MFLTASMECITGRNKREKENDKKKHLKLQGTARKIAGVHANFQIQTYTIFPELILTYIKGHSKGFLYIDYTKTKKKNFE